MAAMTPQNAALVEQAGAAAAALTEQATGLMKQIGQYRLA
jgi:methyl-accepting chemotaxis protein